MRGGKEVGSKRGFVEKTMASPFEPVLGQMASELPEVFRAQYLFGANERAILEGEMGRVWRRGRWLTPLFWLAARFDLLFSETGRNVPVRLTISSEAAAHVWQREFRFPGRLRRFKSRMEYDARLERVVEAIGPGGGRWRSPGISGLSRRRGWRWAQPDGC